jgi:hypothetical protein
VRVAYSDESGVGDSKEPVTVVTAIVINMDRAWRSVERVLEELVLHTNPKLLEEKRGGQALKGRLLYSAIRRKDIPENPEADKALRKALAIPGLCGISIFYGALDRKGYEESERAKDPSVGPRKKKFAGINDTTDYDLAFQQCLRKVDKVGRTYTNERILWIAEQSDSQREPSTRMIRHMHDLNEETEAMYDLSNLDPFKENPMSIVDTIYFVDPVQSLALQLADVCCSTVTLHLLEEYYNWKHPIVLPYYEMIRESVIDATPPMLLEG